MPPVRHQRPALPQDGWQKRRRTGLAWRPAAIVSLAVAGLALGCSSLRSMSSTTPRQRHATSTGHGQPAVLAPPVAWSIPVADLEGRTVGGHHAHQRGIVIASHWLGDNGSVHRTSPGGQVVRWPAPTAVLPSTSLTIRVAGAQPPVRIELLAGTGRLRLIRADPPSRPLPHGQRANSTILAGPSPASRSVATPHDSLRGPPSHRRYTELPTPRRRNARSRHAGRRDSDPRPGNHAARCMLVRHLGRVRLDAGTSCDCPPRPRTPAPRATFRQTESTRLPAHQRCRPRTRRL